jgi:PAS domain S-box-containing protein
MDQSHVSLPRFDVGKPSAGSLADRTLRLVGACHAKPLPWRLAVALVAVLIALAIRIVFLDALGVRLVYVTLYPAVAVAALLGGIAAGILGTVAAAIFAHELISPLASAADAIGLAAFLISCSAIVAMAEMVRIAQVRLVGAAHTGHNEQRMRYFVERVPAAIAMFDTSMRYLAASARWRSDFGIESDVIGRSHYEVFPEISDSWRDIHRRGLAGEGMRADEDLFVRLDGSKQWLRWEVQPWYSGENSVGGITIFCEDLTGQKRTAEQLAQAQKMEIVGNLSGGVAHDFNNLLTVILGNAELLSEQLRARQDLMRISDSIGRAAERGAELTQRLLAFGRRQMLRPVEIDCNRLLGGLHELLRRTLRADVEIKIDFESGLPFAFADSTQLESAVLNLALNAQDAMPAGGRLSISTSAASLDGHYQSQHADVLPGEYVLIAVTDNGEGIPKDVIARVFEPFFTTKEVGKGSGLGLSMVYGFVKQSNGHVSIYSEPGLGTTVRMYLPQAAASSVLLSPDQVRKEDEMLPKGGEIVLVVEDDPFVLSYVVMRLESLGYQVIAAVDGNEALEKLRSGLRVDLLFTDVVMPGNINGWKLAELARKLRPGLPVVLTSGYALETLIEQGSIQAGLVVLTKPYRKADLAYRLREALAVSEPVAMEPAQ